MGHVQHLSFESLVKMDHFQKEPPLNLKGTTGAQGGSKGASTHPKGTDRKSRSESMSALGHSRPSWSRPALVRVRCYSNSGQTLVRLNCPLSAISGHRTRSEMDEAAN